MDNHKDKDFFIENVHSKQFLVTHFNLTFVGEMVLWRECTCLCSRLGEFWSPAYEHRGQ